LEFFENKLDYIIDIRKSGIFYMVIKFKQFISMYTIISIIERMTWCQFS